MFHTLLDQVRAEASGERALESVRALARFHRVQASPGYDEAAAWMAAQLESFGRTVEVERVPGDGRTRLLGQLMPEGWDCSLATAVLHDGASRERLCDYGAEKLSLILRSAPGRGRFAIVALADGTEDGHYEGLDVRGRVVFTSGPPQRVHELAVVERGAAGILTDHRRLVPPVRDRFEDPDALAYTSFWWEGDQPRGWGFVVSPRVGARLRERLAAGARLELEVDVRSRAFATAIPLLSTRIEGRTEGEVVIVSHLCHPQPCANDNASGAAANLEAARVLSALRDRGDFGAAGRSVRFLWVPEFTGTYAWLAADPGRARGALAALNLDMVGQDQELCGSTFLLEHPPCFAASFAEELLGHIRERAIDTVGSTAHGLMRMAEVPYSGGSDHAVFGDPAVGVPCPLLIQWPDRYYHSSHDTPDKTDPRSLVLTARCAATYAAFLAAAADRERVWLESLVARGARARLLRAADAPDPGRAVARERQRGRAALGSLARLGTDPGRIATAQAELEAFAQRELAADLGDGQAPTVSSDLGARPSRRIAAPLHYQRHLLEGWRGLPRAERESWRAREAATPDALLLAELAWFAADGRRSVDDIARLVWLETGRHEPRFLAEFFALATRLGLAGTGTEEESCSPDAPRTAGR